MVWLCLTAIVFFSIFWIHNRRIQIPYSLFITAFLIYNISLLVLLFFRPSEQNYETWNLLPFSTIAFYFTGEVPPLVALYNLGANIGLFIPWGLFLRTMRFSRTQLILLPLFAIIAIEVTQWATQRGSLDIDDLILNMAGVFFGYALFPIWKKVVWIQKA